MDQTFVDEMLECGVRLIGERLPNFHSVTAGIWVGAGSVTETKEENGISHLIEHMLFKGTDVYKRQMLASAANAIIIGFNVRPDNMASAAAAVSYTHLDVYKRQVYIPWQGRRAVRRTEKNIYPRKRCRGTDGRRIPRRWF